MDSEDHHSPSSSCSSSSSSSPSTSASCKAAAASGRAPSPKRKAGRKKFRETRHPVYHGVRERDGGKWVSEVREPRKKTRIWLGTYQTPEMAAMAHDVAAVTLRGDAAHLNFPDLTLALPRARSAAAADVRLAAADAARMFGPSVSVSSTSSSRSPPPPTPPPQCRPVQEEAKEAPRAAPQQQPPAVFLDEEALFNMPGLLEDMARGLLVTPPAWQEGFDWDAVKDLDAVDVWPLWTDD